MIREYIYFVDDNPNGTSGMTEEEVVRYKDCKYGAISYPLYCRNAKGLAAIENENDFCSYGERREE